MEIAKKGLFRVEIAKKGHFHVEIAKKVPIDVGIAKKGPQSTWNCRKGLQSTWDWQKDPKSTWNCKKGPFLAEIGRKPPRFWRRLEGKTPIDVGLTKRLQSTWKSIRQQLKYTHEKKGRDP